MAEVIGAGFELVSGMLDIFVPCANEMALQRTGGKSASFRSRRISALLPELEQHLADEEMFGLTFAWQTGFFPYRTDKIEGWDNWQSWSVINARTWFALTAK